MEERITGRSLPHNEDAERALVGALILDSERIAEVAELLRPEDFFDRRHQLLYQTLVGLSEANVNE